MPVYLPDDLVVAARWCEVGDCRPEASRRAAIVNRVVVPAWRRAKGNRRVAENVVLAPEDPIGARGAFGRCIGKAIANTCRETIDATNVERERRRPFGKVSRQGTMRRGPVPCVKC